MELIPTIVKIWCKVCLNVLKNLIVKNNCAKLNQRMFLVKDK